MSAGAARFAWLARYSKPIPVRGEDIIVLKSPEEFYNTLIVSGAGFEVVYIDWQPRVVGVVSFCNYSIYTGAH